VASRDEVIAFADDLLDLAAWPDYGPMGLQVAGAEEVTRVGCAVSSSLELFELAAKAKVDLLLVHHGLLWDNEPRTIDDRMRRKLEALFGGGITLAAYHLALDAHPEIGNNALLARELGVRVDAPFTNLGVGGQLEPAADAPSFVGRVAELLGREPTAFLEGPASVERVAIISGGAARYAPQAAAEGYDLFLTGEPAEPSLHLARELGIHFVAGGHYATERLGVQALAARIGERFDLPWEFFELPNPV
jgi:dinuclear metal center YbgI/SA1388 family protein